MFLIIKSIFAAIELCCKIVYRILKLLRIRLLALYLVVCLILQLAFHVFDGRAFVFWIGVGVCGFFTLLSWALFLKRKFTKSKLKRERPKAKEAADGTAEAEEALASDEAASVKAKKREKERVKYYDVKGKPDYVFAEYTDRYELFHKSAGGLEYVRTDYKNEK